MEKIISGLLHPHDIIKNLDKDYQITITDRKSGKVLQGKVDDGVISFTPKPENSAHSFTEGSDHQRPPSKPYELEYTSDTYTDITSKVDVEKVIEDLVTYMKPLIPADEDRRYQYQVSIQNAEVALGMIRSIKINAITNKHKDDMDVLAKKHNKAMADVEYENLKKNWDRNDIISRLSRNIDVSESHAESIIEAVEEIIIFYKKHA